MIINDLQRLRWQILDEALRDPVMEYFMGERTKTNETGNTRSLIHFVKTRLKAVNRNYSCSKRMLQNDVNLFQEKGARLEPRFRRGHKRILRYINLDWKNPLLRPARTMMVEDAEAAPQPFFAGPLSQGNPTDVTIRINGETEAVFQLLSNPEIKQRQTDAKKNTTTLTASILLSEAVKAMLFGLGNKVEILAPESLRDDFRQRLATAQKFYGQTSQSKQHKKEEQLSLFDDLF